ncbi:MAG: reverse transcriptase domain-containing protein [Gammaproteobacteria bacterium]|nr:reverse transcriptase domain-containing protein [Gammaproteobacteria bacterium]
MTYPDRLTPKVNLLQEEFVLIQAWKKTASYIRQRSWTVDTIALDRTSINLPSFIRSIRERLESGELWQNKPLRVVPAPKSQQWRIKKGVWEPNQKIVKRLRPLAQVDLADQVVATALMLCLADRVETNQGDTRWSIDCPDRRKNVISYGNRLFCEERNGKLHHRWGSTKLYRAYYQDYRTFLSRSEKVAEQLQKTKRRLVLVHADLQQFYDRVRPSLLLKSLRRLRRNNDDEDFYDIAESILNWTWHKGDGTTIRAYEKNTGLKNFSCVALPQGLVAAGFFANVVLRTFDKALTEKFGCDIFEGVRLLDACRYVDDIRLLLDIEPKHDVAKKDIKVETVNWLNKTLVNHAEGLSISKKKEKTRVVFLDDEEQPLLRQRAKMNRLQAAISEGLDLTESVEALDAASGLLRAQLMLNNRDRKAWRYSPVPDVRDETVARFSASKFLNTFRRIRPQLESERSTTNLPSESVENTDKAEPDLLPTQNELDEDAKVFALALVEQWMKNPSNVRVLLVGLDLWPDVRILTNLFKKLHYYVSPNSKSRSEAAKLVACYCLAEILRAGATSTGFVSDVDSLPSDLDLLSYRRRLCEEALYLVNTPRLNVPWYLLQQALLVLASLDSNNALLLRRIVGPEVKNHVAVIKFLRGERHLFSDAEQARLAVLARRSFLNREQTEALVLPNVNLGIVRRIARLDPSFAYELLERMKGTVDIERLPNRVKADLCLHPSTSSNLTLADAVLTEDRSQFRLLRNEISILIFARKFLKQWSTFDSPPTVITPGQVILKLSKNHELLEEINIESQTGTRRNSKSLYEVPSWCSPNVRWRVQLGFLLRFILAGTRDYTRPVRSASWKEDEGCYRSAESHWYQRIHGMYMGQPVFGDDWLPISEWVEGFLLALLRWPGCQVPAGFEWLTRGIRTALNRIDRRIKKLRQLHGRASNLQMLPLKINNLPRNKDDDDTLRVCVVQTAMPTTDHLSNKYDPSLSNKNVRRQHRNHLAAVLTAIKHVAKLREPHQGNQRLLDWLILPELAVHPNDVQTHLVPFARANRAVILAGLTYESLFPDQPLVNSALWIIPEISRDHGMQIKIRRQGKMHLALSELEHNCDGRQRMRGFRPCQWLIGYPWSSSTTTEPLWLTAAVCYDATDLALATDLRDRSDVLAIPAFNKDVNTFDQMALALHYHMFQLVIVANNGEYGGSNAYWPKRDSYERQIFHFHGQSQANIFFFEIEEVEEFTKRFDKKKITKERTRSTGWKYPPAGLKCKR